MNLIKFFRGPKASYSAASTHKDALYFATDSNELIMNGNSYGDKIKDNGLTFTEVQSGANKGHVVATIELNSGKTFANVDLGVYGRSEVDSKIASVNSDTTTLAGRVTTAEGNITSLDTRLTSAEGSITTLTAGSSTEGSVAYQIAQIVANAPASFDTLKEIADWIANDTTGAAKMAADIETLKTGKVDKVTGKQLSTEDYTTAEKTKLAGIEAGALVNPTNVSAFTNDSKYVTEDDMLVPVVDANGHEYVDLGLPSGTLWATMNVGASSETDYGNYYQYGKGAAQYAATSGDSNYSGTENPLDSSVDTAVQVWGGSWHMPTRAQMQELTDNTTYQWVTDYKGSGINGGTFTATNGAVLFFPAAGAWANGSQLSVGRNGYYCGSSPNGMNDTYDLNFYDGDKGVYSSSRKIGYSVRGVIEPSKAPKYATKAELTSTESTLNTADTTTNTRITNLTGQEGSTYTARSTEDASFIKNATNIQDALNKLDDASMALTTLLTWQEIEATVSTEATGAAYYRVVDSASSYPLVDATGRCIVFGSGSTKLIIVKDASTGEYSSTSNLSYIDTFGETDPVSHTSLGGMSMKFTIGSTEYTLGNDRSITPEPQQYTA